MENIKNKISKIEEVKKEIKKLNAIVSECNPSHLKPAICITNNGSVFHSVIIEQSLFEKLVKDQIEILKSSIEDDVKFIDAVELMINTTANTSN